MMTKTTGGSAVRILHFLFLSLFLALPAVSTAAEQKEMSAAAPEWRLMDPDGTQVRFPAGGERISILFFWATWCPYCKALMPHVQSIVDEYGAEEVDVYAINIRDDGDPKKFLEDAGYQFQLLMDGDDVAKMHNIFATPGLLIVDRNNRIVFDLYELMAETQDAPEWKSLSHRQRASRRGPYWAAHIRRALDEVIGSR